MPTIDDMVHDVLGALLSGDQRRYDEAWAVWRDWRIEHGDGVVMPERGPHNAERCIARDSRQEAIARRERVAEDMQRKGGRR